MAKKKRISRDEIDKDIDLLIPLDIFSLGSEEDPCFGELHDLKAPECMDCGDSEFCAIVKAQKLNIKRLEIEAKQRFKDIEQADKITRDKKDKARELVIRYKKLGKKRVKSISNIANQLSLPKDIVKEIYDQN